MKIIKNLPGGRLIKKKELFKGSKAKLNFKAVERKLINKKWNIIDKRTIKGYDKIKKIKSS